MPPGPIQSYKLGDYEISLIHHCRNNLILLLILFLLLLGTNICASQQLTDLPTYDVALPTAEPSGNPVNDQVLFRFYPVLEPTGQPAPAVVLIHSFGDPNNELQFSFARYLATQGIASAVMTLPYHMGRLPPRDSPWRHFLSSNVEKVIAALHQSASDVSTIVAWLEHQPSADPHRIGVIGISLGAIVAHLAMGKDERITAGVAILGGGDVEDIYRNGILGKVLRLHLPSHPSPELTERILSVDPITFADRNRPRHVLMIQAARDILVPPRDSTALWNALGRPPIRWLDTNHYAPLLAQRPIMRISAFYLKAVWNDPNFDAKALPPLSAPTIKVGMLFNLDSVLTIGIQWQALTFATRRDHMSLLHADLGWSGRGPFIGLAATMNPYLDLGIGHRFLGSTYPPYLSLHFVF